MKKIVALSILIGLITGCNQTVGKPELMHFETMCKDRGGIYNIDTMLFNNAKCMDNTWAKQLTEREAHNETN